MILLTLVLSRSAVEALNQNETVKSLLNSLNMVEVVPDNNKAAWLPVCTWFVDFQNEVLFPCVRPKIDRANPKGISISPYAKALARVPSKLVPSL